MGKSTLCATVVFITAVTAGLALGDAGHSAETNSPQTLEEYLRYAALRNVGLKAAFEQWKAALEEIPQAQAWPDPRFTYGYFIEAVETRVGPQRHRVGIAQVFPWFGKIEARKDAAAAEARAARERYEARKLELFYEVKDGFYEYLYLRSAIDIARDHLDLVRHFEEVARAKYVTATARHPDIVRAQVELATLQDQLEALNELRGPIVARLNAALNRPGDGLLPWPTRPEMLAVELERADLFDALKHQNPRLQAKQFELESARSRIELAKRRFYPDVGVGVDWIATGEAISPGVRDSGKDPVILMFSMNLPIWRKSYRAAELRARAAARRLSHERKDLENGLVAQVERVLYDFDDSGRKVRLYDDALVPKAEELVGASETAYAAGTVDFLSLMDAERTLLRFRLEHERAKTTRRQKLAELEMLVGQELSAAVAAQGTD